VAGVQLADLQSEKQLAAHIANLSLLGCFVETVTPFPEGTNVRLKISHASVNLIAIGKVAYSRPQSGMGVAFTTIEPSNVPILDAWLENLRK